MKRLILSLLLIAPILTFGQSNNVSEQTTAEKPSWNNFKTNKFWDNWFISGGFGGAVMFTPADSKGSFGKRIAPTFDLAAGKWLLPTIGIRAQINGIKLKGFTMNGGSKYAVGKADSDGLYKQEMEQYNLMIQGMLNISNWIGGYRSDRFYEFVPFAGFGLLHTWTNGVDNELSFNAGLINKMRICSSWDLNVEFRGILAPSKYFAENSSKRLNGIGSATIGLTYRFKRRGFDRPDEINYDELNRLLADNRDLTNEVASLRNQLKNTPAPAPAVVLPKEEPVAKAIFFEINKSKINDLSKANLRKWAEEIKANPEKSYLLLGYADKTTGSRAYNQTISKKRADNVYEFLTKECGVNPKQLKVSPKGGVDSMMTGSIQSLSKLSKEQSWSKEFPALHPQRVVIIEE